MKPGDIHACPCQSGRPYAGCCGPLHRGELHAATAEALMRSRYRAYARGDAAYLRATWHPSTRPATLEPDDARTRWLGLEVRGHHMPGPAHATVEFVARYRVAGAPAVRLHEISRFVREGGRWYYLDGEFPARG